MARSRSPGAPSDSAHPRREHETGSVDRRRPGARRLLAVRHSQANASPHAGSARRHDRVLRDLDRRFVGTEIGDPYVSELVDTDDTAAGTLIGQAMCKFSGGKGTALVMGGAAGDSAGDARQVAAAAAVKACKMTDFVQPGDTDAAKEVAIATSAMKDKVDLVAIFVPHGDGAAAVAKMVGDTGRSRYIAVYGFDADPAEIAAILGGMETGSVRQDGFVMARTAVDNAMTVIAGGTVPKTVMVPPLLVDQSTASLFR